jgi:3-hydroxyisobutyrate dehydrogenase-like beta-hydroxyacid dehydrogenase
MQRIGFIGAAGLMGHGMARCILGKGLSLSLVLHRERDRVADLVAGGATLAASPAELAQRSDALILCVPSSVEVEASMLGPQGIVAGAREGLVVIDTTTAEPASTLRLGEVLAAEGVRFADAPLMRTPVQAEEGLLNSVVGADDALFAHIRPLLATYCENIWQVGPLGAGHTLKLVNNFITQGTAALIAEACTTATRAGVDLEKLFAVISEGGANSSVFQRMMPWILGRSEGGMLFKLRHAQKDVRYYTHLAEAVGSTAFLGEAVHQTFTLAMAQGEGEAYVPAIARGLARANGIELGPKE